MSSSVSHAHVAKSTNSGYNAGITLYNQFACKKGEKVFDDLKPCDIQKPNFRNLAVKFMNWICNGEARNKKNEPYTNGHSTLPQYFSNWYNAMLKRDDLQDAISKENPELWHKGMTEMITKRLTSASVNRGVDLVSSNNSITRSTFVDMIRYILSSSKGDSLKERKAWEVRYVCTNYVYSCL